MNLITKTRILLKITETWGNIEKFLGERKKLNMKVSVNSVIQILVMALQGLNQVSDILPVKGKFWAMIAISAVQGIVSILSHFVNPDGTPAAQPYVK